MAGSTGPDIVTDGLVFTVDAANKKSYPGTGTDWTDLSGNGNHGTLVNGPTFNSENGGSLVFDGSNDKVTINSTTGIITGNTFTFSTWLNFNSYTSIIAAGNSYTDGGYVLYVANSTTLYTVLNGGATYGSITTANLSLGTFINITVLKTGSSIEYFQNGISIGTSAVGDSNLIIRCLSGYNSSGAFPFNGKISITYHYNRALSEAEVLQNYNATKNRFI